jgi:hypothetical protein
VNKNKFRIIEKAQTCTYHTVYAAFPPTAHYGTFLGYKNRAVCPAFYGHRGRIRAAKSNAGLQLLPQFGLVSVFLLIYNIIFLLLTLRLMKILRLLVE